MNGKGKELTENKGMEGKTVFCLKRHIALPNIEKSPQYENI